MTLIQVTASLRVAARTTRRTPDGAERLRWTFTEVTLSRSAGAATGQPTRARRGTWTKSCWSVDGDPPRMGTLHSTFRLASPASRAWRGRGGCPSCLAGSVTCRRLPLSRRECEVAALIAKGLADRQIAEQLTYGGHGGVHVSQMLNKLGHHTRAEIANWAVQHGLGPGADLTLQQP
jgi:DNA-binding CsgD family transcriptional regulator